MYVVEDLNKTQTILLCLLVSFVTSVGTGIITVSLLQEAPQSITQTINRVVERTVEKVTPQSSGKPEKEVTTVVVKEEDLVIDAIKKNSRSVVRIYENLNNNGTTGLFYGLGLVIGKNGVILADKRVINPNGSYLAKFFDDRIFPLRVVSTNDRTNTIFLEPAGDKGNYSFVSAEIGNSDAVQLGQTVIVLGGKDRNSVAIGRIRNLTQDESQGTGTSTKPIIAIETDSPLIDSVSGSVMLTLSGQIIGFEDFSLTSSQENYFTAIGLIRKENIALFETSQKSQ